MTRSFFLVIVCGFLGAPQIGAAATSKKFETFGIVCETRGQTVLTPFTQIAEGDPDPNVVNLPSLVPPQCRGTVRATGFSWSKLDPRELEETKRGKRSTVIARIAGTISGPTFRVTDLQTTDLTSVRFDGFNLARPAIFNSSLIGRNWPSSCNLADSPVLSVQVPTGARAALTALLKDEPDLRVRTLINGAQEIVTYRPLSDPIQALAHTLHASVCVEQDTSPLSVEQVWAFVRNQKIMATVINAVLPSGRRMVLVVAEQISLAHKSLIMKNFGSRVAIDSVTPNLKR